MTRPIASWTAIGAVATLTAGLAGVAPPAAADIEAPAPPTNLRITDLQPETLSVAWDATSGATSYSLTLFAPEPFCGTYYRRHTTASLTATFDSLNWDCPYRIGVRAYVPSNYPNTFSEPATILVTTPLPEGYERPGPPSNLRAERDATGQLERVAWDPATVGFGLLAYQMYLEVEGIPELSGTLGSLSVGTSRDVERDLGDIGSVLEPGQTVTLWVTTADQTRTESPPSETLVLTCCPL